MNLSSRSLKTRSREALETFNGSGIILKVGDGDKFASEVSEKKH